MGLLGFILIVATSSARPLPNLKVAADIPVKFESPTKPIQQTPESTPETVAMKAAKEGEFGTVKTPAGRRSTRLARKKADAKSCDQKPRRLGD